VEWPTPRELHIGLYHSRTNYNDRKLLLILLCTLKCLLLCRITAITTLRFKKSVHFLADVNSRSRSLYAIADPSVCRLSVTLVHPTEAVELFGNLFSPYYSPGTLLFWCQKLLVGDAPFPLKFAFKVTHPLPNSEILTNIGL